MDLVIRGSKVDPDYVFVEAIKDGGIESIGISMTVISLVTGFFLYTTWKRKLKKVVFASWSNEKVKVTTIPAYIALVIWFVRNAIHWELVGKEEWYVIGIEIFLVVVGIAYSFAKSDVSSRNIAVMVFGTLITLTWMTPYIFNQIYNIKINTMIVISFAAIASAIIYLLMVFSGRSISKTQSGSLIVLTVISSIVLLAYAFIRTLGINLSYLPIDLHELLLMLLWLVPIVFMLTGVFGFLTNQISIRSNIVKSINNAERNEDA